MLSDFTKKRRVEIVSNALAQVLSKLAAPSPTRDVSTQVARALGTPGESAKVAEIMTRDLRHLATETGETFVMHGRLCKRLAWMPRTDASSQTVPSVHTTIAEARQLLASEQPRPVKTYEGSELRWRQAAVKKGLALFHPVYKFEIDTNQLGIWELLKDECPHGLHPSELPTHDSPAGWYWSRIRNGAPVRKPIIQGVKRDERWCDPDPNWQSEELDNLL